MIDEAIAHLGHARGEVDAAFDVLVGGVCVEDGATACARAVEELCAALSELTWSACDRAVYGDGDDECPER